MKAAAIAPDWAFVIDSLAQAGVTTREIGDAMCQQMTDKMLWYYRRGTQPVYWRGALLLAFWSKRTGQAPDKVPMIPVVRGHRARRRIITGPQIGEIAALVDWIKPEQKVVDGKRRKPRVKKGEVAA